MGWDDLDLDVLNGWDDREGVSPVYCSTSPESRAET